MPTPRTVNPSSRLLSAVVALLTGLVAVGYTGLWLRHSFAAGWSPVVIGVAGWFLVSMIVLASLHRHPHPLFGAANSITSARAVITVGLASSIPVAPSLTTPAMEGAVWLMAAMTLIALLLDGIDGLAARAGDNASEFGARYDMEVDALLVLVLCALLWQLGEAGPWILAIGLLRYLFVAAGLLLPRLQGELYPSFRRKLVCVVQVATLCLMLTPTVGGSVSVTLGLCALAALLWSFARDTRWLLDQASAP